LEGSFVNVRPAEADILQHAVVKALQQALLLFPLMPLKKGSDQGGQKTDSCALCRSGRLRKRV
jgi:hypothetical protein